MKIIIIDNYDSFTYNIFQYVASLTRVSPQVFYNDKISYPTFEKISADAVIVSPGPGNPNNINDFGVSGEIIKQSNIPLLGICLGHQGIAGAFGGKIIKAPNILHGRTSKIYHHAKGLFKKIPQGFEAVRYHSLIIEEKTLPKELTKTAWTKDGIIMAIEHREKPIYGVQFHPESIGTRFGQEIINNFLKIAKQS